MFKQGIAARAKIADVHYKLKSVSQAFLTLPVHKSIAKALKPQTTCKCMYVVLREMKRYLALCHIMRLGCRLQYELQVVLAHEALQAVLGVHLRPPTILRLACLYLSVKP